MKQLFCVLMLAVGLLIFSACQGGNGVSPSPEIKKPDYKFEEIKIPPNFRVPKNTVLIDAGHGCIGKTKYVSQNYL